MYGLNLCIIIKGKVKGKSPASLECGGLTPLLTRAAIQEPLATSRTRPKRRQAAADQSAVEPAHSKELTLARTVA
jgi:hypothetical protein